MYFIKIVYNKLKIWNLILIANFNFILFIPMKLFVGNKFNKIMFLGNLRN